jgi:protein phosphatase
MFLVWYKTDVGLKRKNNQDAILINEALNLYIIADGMGGHNGGERASHLAIESIEAYFIEHSRKSDVRGLIVSALEKANKEIYLESLDHHSLKGMGTTCSLLYQDGALHIGHVGDSRIYFIKNNEIHQVTVDHTLVENLIAKGEIDREEAKSHPRKNVITRAVGTDVDLRVDYGIFPKERADHILICSDGLINKIEDQEIMKIVLENTGSKSVEALVELANARGGSDNISVILLSSTDQSERGVINDR